MTTNSCGISIKMALIWSPRTTSKRTWRMRMMRILSSWLNLKSAKKRFLKSSWKLHTKESMKLSRNLSRNVRKTSLQKILRKRPSAICRHHLTLRGNKASRMSRQNSHLSLRMNRSDYPKRLPDSKILSRSEPLWSLTSPSRNKIFDWN